MSAYLSMVGIEDAISAYCQQKVYQNSKTVVLFRTWIVFWDTQYAKLTYLTLHIWIVDSILSQHLLFLFSCQRLFLATRLATFWDLICIGYLQISNVKYQISLHFFKYLADTKYSISNIVATRVTPFRNICIGQGHLQISLTLAYVIVHANNLKVLAE